MATVAEALNIALKRHQSGNLPQAEAIYRQVLAVDPANPQALHFLGVVALQMGQPAAAVEHIQRACQIDPLNATYHGNLGSAYGTLGRYDKAVESLKAALRCDPNFADAHNNLGAAFSKLGKNDEAAAAIRRALKLRPTLVAAHINLGNVLQEQARLDEATASYRQALRLDPDNVDARYNLGLAVSKRGEYAQAEENYRHALRINPRHADALNNLGNALREQGRFADSLACYEQALSVKPDLSQARKNRGMAWLRLGDWQRGWAEYEWRWRCDDSPPHGFRQPLWDGSSLEGRTILLHTEQGLGDAIQFLRYVPLVKERCGTVLLQCQPPLMKLFAQAAGVDQLVPRGEKLPPYDVYAPLLSLPHLLGVNDPVSAGSVPYLFANPKLAEHWHWELARIEGRKIGINWQGNPNHPKDVQRSLPLSHFLRLAEVPGVRLISLQKNAGIEQLRQSSASEAVLDLGSRLDEEHGAFMDTAAVLASLDLVITSDTALAHLAGALGVSVWVVLPFSPDWRWMLDRDDSPWYPTMRLFRQRQPGDWSEVFERIAAELATDEHR
jgi:tetratricopeptide (TPR) repeat protein